MSKIHYATGGLITPEKSEFSTLCGRKFPQGHSAIMQSGYVGAQNVTCEDCRFLLDIQQKREVVWYEVTDGKGMSSHAFNTLEEAREHLKDERSGFRTNNPNMSEENRAYWRKHGKKSYIVKVTNKVEFREI